MIEDTAEPLPDEAKLALAYTQVPLRDPLRVFFELDLRLGRLVSATTEPMLGQMRLAWWRETLVKDEIDWPNGDHVLDGVKEHWQSRASSLLPLVDAWEHLLSDPPLAAEDAIAFANGRRDALTSVFELEAADSAQFGIADAAWHWALADLASKVTLLEEREILIDLARDRALGRLRLPRHAKGIAVIGALGRRALERGGRPLMEGRGASLVAIRAAITGL
ncbi:MAG: hypothetical protein AAGL10_02585 [Pseudomonadota bacterium]